jgi:hypothetical protein
MLFLNGLIYQCKTESTEICSSPVSAWEPIMFKDCPCINLGPRFSYGIFPSVTERSDSHRILTKGSLVYVEMIPCPRSIFYGKQWPLFRRIHCLGVIFLRVGFRKWHRRIMTRGSFFYVEMRPPVNILQRKVTPFFVIFYGFAVIRMHGDVVIVSV